jgi:hypothetical protein
MEKTADGQKFHAFDYPEEGQTISNVKTNPLLKKAFNLIPGMRIDLESNGEKFEWEVFTDAYNYTYIYCHTTEAYAYFVNNETLFYFTRFVGDQESPLFAFYTGAYKVLLGYYDRLKIEDQFPVDDIYSGFVKGMLDIIAPFYQVVKADYQLHYDEIDDGLEPAWLKMSSSLKVNALGKTQKQKDFQIELNEKGLSSFMVSSNGNKKVFECEVR